MNNKLRKIGRYLPVANIVLLLLSIAYIAWVWHNMLTAESDTMLIGLLYLFVMAVSIYYLALLVWAVVVLKKHLASRSKRRTSFMILALTVTPYILGCCFLIACVAA